MSDTEIAFYGIVGWRYLDIILLMPSPDHQHRQQDRFREGGGLGREGES